MNTTFDTVYKDYPVKPYIFPNLDMEGPKPVPKRKMKLLEIAYNLKEKIRKKSFMNTILETFYKDHQVKPFISSERDLDAWLLNPKPVPK